MSKKRNLCLRLPVKTMDILEREAEEFDTTPTRYAQGIIENHFKQPMD